MPADNDRTLDSSGRAWTELEQVVGRFEDSWKRGERPLLANFLPHDPRGRTDVLLELVHTDLEYRLKAGEEVRVEDYLICYPELAQSHDKVVTLIAAEYELRRRFATAIGADTYLRRFPQYRSELRARLAQRPAGVHGPKINGYEVLGELARGGMGVVYRARQLSLGRVVALKMILAGSHAGPQELLRFRAEGEAVARLQHPNIVQIFEVGQQENLPFFAMEYIEGGSLTRKIGGRPLPAREAAQLVETLARAVQYAHSKGVVHRDLKPANVLLTEDGTPKITDFGLAKQLDGDTNLTSSGAIVGTPNYMAPEQAAGKVKEIGPAADIYALGGMFYELLTGRPPFHAPTALETLQKVLHADPVPPTRHQPQVPRDLDTICLKCLEKEPHRRYASAGALAEDLGRFLAGKPIAARPATVLERLVKWVRRRPRTAWALVLGGLALLLGVVASLWR